jgi:hypothetical protein
MSRSGLLRARSLNDSFGVDTGLTRRDSCRSAVRPIEASKARVRYVRFTSRPCEKAMFKSLCGSSRAYAGAAGKRVGFADGLDFQRRGAQAALIAWMSGCTPRMAIIRFRL